MLDKHVDEQCEKSKHHAAERKPRQEGPDAQASPPKNPLKCIVDKDWRTSVCSYYCGFLFRKNSPSICSCQWWRGTARKAPSEEFR